MFLILIFESGSIHFLLRRNVCFKRYTWTLSNFTFEKSKGDFHMKIFAFSFFTAICLDSNTKF